MQDEQVIAYESRKLKNYEHNYAPHDLELAAIVYFEVYFHPTKS